MVLFQSLYKSFSVYWRTSVKHKLKEEEAMEVPESSRTFWRVSDDLRSFTLRGGKERGGGNVQWYCI